MDSEKREEPLRKRPYRLTPLQSNPDFQKKPTAKDRPKPIHAGQRGPDDILKPSTKTIGSPVTIVNGISGDKADISSKPDSLSQCNSVNERQTLKKDEAATVSIPIISCTDCPSGCKDPDHHHGGRETQQELKDKDVSPCTLKCTKPNGKTQQPMKDVDQGDNLSFHSFNEADFQSERNCDSVEKNTPASVETALNPDTQQLHLPVPPSESALKTAWVPVKLSLWSRHREREKQEAQWTKAREETQSMVQHNLNILENNLLASFGRISEDLDIRKYLNELSRPEAENQIPSRLGGYLRRLKIRLMRSWKERDHRKKLDRSGPEVKALLRMVRRNGSNADLNVEEQERWESHLDRLSEHCRSCKEQMMESLQELLSSLHCNQTEKKHPAQTFVSRSLAPPTLVVSFTDKKVTKPQTPPVALAVNIRPCPVPPTFTAPFTTIDIPGSLTPSGSESPPTVKLRPHRSNLPPIVTVSSNTRKEGPDKAQEGGDGKKKNVKTRKQKEGKETRPPQVEHNNSQQV